MPPSLIKKEVQISKSRKKIILMCKHCDHSCHCSNGSKCPVCECTNCEHNALDEFWSENG
jgi:hypothetical protein